VKTNGKHEPHLHLIKTIVQKIKLGTKICKVIVQGEIIVWIEK